MYEVHELQHNHLGTEHLLLGLLRERQGMAAMILNELGLTLERARSEVLHLLASR